MACSIIFLLGIAAIAVAIYLGLHFYAGDDEDFSSAGKIYSYLGAFYKLRHVKPEGGGGGSQRGSEIKLKVRSG